MSQLLAAGRPSNLRTPGLNAVVESDVFDICNRVKEIDPDLTVWANDEGHKHRFTIQGIDREGNEYPILFVDELDARVIDELRRRMYLQTIPFAKRWAEFEKLEAQREKVRDTEEREKLYEKMGYQFYRQLDRCGFIQRSDILPKANRTAQRYRSTQPRPAPTAIPSGRGAIILP